MQPTTPKSQPAAKPLAQMSDDELREIGLRAWRECFGKKSSRVLLGLLELTKLAPRRGRPPKGRAS